MRILFAITNGDRGGAQEHVLILCRGLVDRGHAVTVLVTEPSDLATRLAGLGVVVEPWPSVVRNPSPLRDLVARRELRRAVERHRPDVLTSTPPRPACWGAGILTPPAGVTIYTCHHAPFGPGRRLTHRLLARPVEQLTLRYTHGIISVGARRHADAAPPRTRRPGRAGPQRRARRRSAAGFGGPARRGGGVGRGMAHPKDPLQVVEAWEHVVADRPRAKLIMVGTGPLADALRTRIDASPAKASIDYRGRVPSVQDTLAEGSVYLLATQVEGGTTMATLEAMTAGLVPVMSDAGDAFLLTHSDCGLVVARNAPRALAAAVVELLDDPERLQAMRHRAVEFTRAWTVDDMVGGTEAVYRAVLDRSSAP